MKTIVALLVAACFVAFAHSYPRAREPEDSSEEAAVLLVPSESDESSETSGWRSFNFNPFAGFNSILFPGMLDRLNTNLLNYFWNMPDLTSIPAPEGANTTSTVKVINGHVVTINETTYSSGDDKMGMAFRVRIIDVKPENESGVDDVATTLPTTTTTTTTAAGATNKEEEEERTTTTRSVETVEEFDNEIPKNQVDTLSA